MKSHSIDQFITSHPLARSLRANPSITESRPYQLIPASLRAQHLTAGGLTTPTRIATAPYVWAEKHGKSLTSIFYLGADVCGFPGLVHGGLLATLLDEGMATCCFPALPNGFGVTTTLNVEYVACAPADEYLVLKARTVKVEGGKAWVEGRIESLPLPEDEEEEEPVVFVKATAVYVEPRSKGGYGRLL